jgi:hypothetical protein
MYKRYLVFCEMLNTFIGTECLCGAVDLVCDLLSGDSGIYFGVWRTEKHCGHIIPFILHSFNLFSMLAFISKFVLSLERKLSLSSFQKENISSLCNYSSIFINQYQFQNT